jgi:hypothetical protein
MQDDLHIVHCRSHEPDWLRETAWLCFPRPVFSTAFQITGYSEVEEVALPSISVMAEISRLGPASVSTTRRVDLIDQSPIEDNRPEDARLCVSVPGKSIIGGDSQSVRRLVMVEAAGQRNRLCRTWRLRWL